MSDGEDNGRYADAIDIIITPPDLALVSDTEDLDDDIQILNDENQIPREVAGNFEIEYQFNDENRFCLRQDENAQPSTSGKCGGTMNIDETVKIADDEDESDKQPLEKRRRTPACKSDEVPLEKRRKTSACKVTTKWSRRAVYSFDKEPFDDTMKSYKALVDRIGMYCNINNYGMCMCVYMCICICFR